ncbi:hypothetical protein [Paenibacillus sp. IHB B 3084]|nr:hypothetical protein [Paenibacillus sp. IHB B 3084]
MVRSALGGWVTTKAKLIDVSWFGGIVEFAASLLAVLSYKS